MRREAVLTWPVVAVLALSLTGCKGIDKSQWSTGTTSSGSGGTVRASVGTTSTVSGSSVTGGSGTSGSGTTARSNTVSINGSAGELGITAGAAGGGRSSSESTVLVRADSAVCWLLVVDGNPHRGCGDAQLTDTRGAAAARVVKTAGTGAVVLQLQSAGHAVDSGTVTGIDRYVTVAGARG